VKHDRSTNWLQAEKLLLDNLRKYPESEELAIELADIYFGKKYYRRAINICQNALLYSDNEELINIIANSFLCLGEYQIALSYYNRLQNESPELLYNKAVTLARTGQLDEAIEIARRVTEYNIKSPVPYILLAELYFYKKDFKRAVSCCSQAQSIAGISGDICYLRGMAWLAQKNILKAYWDFHQGEIFSIENPEYYRSYGIVCEGIGKTDKAIELLKKAILLAPDKPGSYLELFRIYLMNNMLELATELLHKARSSLPEDFPLTIMYNQIIGRLTESHH